MAVTNGMINHYWIKTGSQEAGMGAACPEPGQQCSDAPYTSTHTIDHTGQSNKPGASCEEMNNVDESCVDNLIKPGRPTGTWSPVNQCQSWTYSTINQCRTGPQISPSQSPGPTVQPPKRPPGMPPK